VVIVLAIAIPHPVPPTDADIFSIVLEKIIPVLGIDLYADIKA
jgi:hypothetical protein